MSHNVTNNRNLSANQQKALRALLEEPTITEAASSCGLARKTLHAYLNDPAFAEAYREARDRLVDDAVARLQKVGTEAVGVLHDALSDEDVNVRVRAARYVLDMLFKTAEIAELKRQVEEIQAFDRQQQRKGRG